MEYNLFVILWGLLALMYMIMGGVMYRKDRTTKDADNGIAIAIMVVGFIHFGLVYAVKDTQSASNIGMGILGFAVFLNLGVFVMSMYRYFSLNSKEDNEVENDTVFGKMSAKSVKTMNIVLWVTSSLGLLVSGGYLFKAYRGG